MRRLEFATSKKTPASHSHWSFVSEASLKSAPLRNTFQFKGDSVHCKHFCTGCIHDPPPMLGLVLAPFTICFSLRILARLRKLPFGLPSQSSGRAAPARLTLGSWKVRNCRALDQRALKQQLAKTWYAYKNLCARICVNISSSNVAPAPCAKTGAKPVHALAQTIRECAKHCRNCGL